jgi:hypothetical protein
MKYFSVWQRLVDEDHHTALVFGFMRHAPREAALNPWLSEVLGRPVEAESLSLMSFWPRLPSVMENTFWTEPELMFAASDPEPLLVVVEVKPGFGGFTLDQIKHEVIALRRTSGRRVATCSYTGSPGSRRSASSRS